MQRGMIVAPQPEAAEAGATVLRRGGNAVDAAIAGALVQTVVDPQMCGIAGCGTMQVCLPGRGIHQSLDFHARCPAAATPSGDIEVSSRIPEYVTDAVEQMGCRVVRTPQRYAFAAVHGVMLRAGVLSGGADPQRGGAALLV